MVQGMMYLLLLSMSAHLGIGEHGGHIVKKWHSDLGPGEGRGQGGDSLPQYGAYKAYYSLKYPLAFEIQLLYIIIFLGNTVDGLSHYHYTMLFFFRTNLRDHAY